jgi:hypothetical protein
VGVKGHWRYVKPRRKKRVSRSRKPPAGGYWVAENEHGKRCGHHHRTLTAAVQCARRTQRHYRAKYGRKSSLGGTWTSARVKG